MSPHHSTPSSTHPKTIPGWPTSALFAGFRAKHGGGVLLTRKGREMMEALALAAGGASGRTEVLGGKEQTWNRRKVAVT